MCNDKKSPDTDGLPADWYKVFFSHIKIYLHEAFWKPLRMVISTHQPEGVYHADHQEVHKC